MPATFAAAARRFLAWATADVPATGAANDAAPPNEAVARADTALRELLALYGAALELLEPWAFGKAAASLDAAAFAAEADGTVAAVPHERLEPGLERARAGALTLPLRRYGEVFDPLPLPPEEPVTGDLVDDLVDICRDLAAGLALHDAGRPEEAAARWAFTLVTHWGEHATGAMRALHAYLAHEALEGFIEDR